MIWISPNGSNALRRDIDFTGYTSQALPFITRELQARQDGRVLDLGPVCGENVAFLAQRAKKLFVCDLFLALDRERRTGLTGDAALKGLDYPARSFDLILLWDLTERLSDEQVRVLVDLCRHMVRPKGMVGLFVTDARAGSTEVHSHVMGDDSKISFRHQPHLELSTYKRQPRDLIALLRPFTMFKSFIYRNGVREFLLQGE